MKEENANDKLKKWLEHFNELPELQCAYCGVVFRGGHECDYKKLKEKVGSLQQELGFYKQYYEDHKETVFNFEKEIEELDESLRIAIVGGRDLAVYAKQLNEKIERYEKALFNTYVDGMTIEEILEESDKWGKLKSK